MGVNMDREKLRKLIDKSGKTINAIQEESGMKSGALYRLLSGKHKDVTLSVAFKLADALGADIKEFRKEE